MFAVGVAEDGNVDLAWAQAHHQALHNGYYLMHPCAGPS
jgi:hypothetical protein